MSDTTPPRERERVSGLRFDSELPEDASSNRPGAVTDAVAAFTADSASVPVADTDADGVAEELEDVFDFPSSPPELEPGDPAVARFLADEDFTPIPTRLDAPLHRVPGGWSQLGARPPVEGGEVAEPAPATPAEASEVAPDFIDPEEFVDTDVHSIVSEGRLEEVIVESWSGAEIFRKPTND